VHGILAFLVTGADSGEVRRCSEIRDPDAIVSEQDVSWFEIFVLDMLLVDICSATVVTMEPTETYLVKLVPKNCCSRPFVSIQVSFGSLSSAKKFLNSSRSSRKADSNGPELQSEPFPMGIRSYYANDVLVSKPFHRFNLPAIIEPDSMSVVYILPR
jgi:hypothetical protein